MSYKQTLQVQAGLLALARMSHGEQGANTVAHAMENMGAQTFSPTLAAEMAGGERVRSEYVSCPVCGEPHMRKDVDGDDNALIQCTNHECRSNGGAADQRPGAHALDTLRQQAATWPKIVDALNETVGQDGWFSGGKESAIDAAVRIIRALHAQAQRAKDAAVSLSTEQQADAWRQVLAALVELAPRDFAMRSGGESDGECALRLIRWWHKYAMGAPDTVTRADFDAKVADLARAKELITMVYGSLGAADPRELRNMIERRTGGWFSLGMNRDEPAPALSNTVPLVVVEFAAAAAAQAFDDTFHKVAAEVSRDWWNKIWMKAIDWARTSGWTPPGAAVVSWRDAHDVAHCFTPDGAARVLKELYTEWPGGLDEVRAELNKRRKRLGDMERLLENIGVERKGNDLWLNVQWGPGHGHFNLGRADKIAAGVLVLWMLRTMELLHGPAEPGQVEGAAALLTGVAPESVAAHAALVRAAEGFDPEDAHYAAAEREHFGDPDKATGIYAAPVALKPEFVKGLEELAAEVRSIGAPPAMPVQMLGAEPAQYEPLTMKELRDLTAMVEGAPWSAELITDYRLGDVIAAYERCRAAGQRPVDPADAGTRRAPSAWIDWDGSAIAELHGKPCYPKPPGVLGSYCDVTVRFRDGTTLNTTQPEQMRWAWSRPYLSCADIMAYKLGEPMPF